MISNNTTEILRVEHLTKHFVKKGFLGPEIRVRAVDDASFSIKQNEVFVIAGESGSGKSTIARLILRAIEPDSGKIYFDGVHSDESNLEEIRANCQMVQQDPYDSINPRMKVKDIISEPLEIHSTKNTKERRGRLLEVLSEVKLESVKDILNRYPHMLSGGQRQRVVLARALILKPRIIIADEPVSMLDVSIRAEILELMKDLQTKNNITFIYITHDLATARHFGDNIAVMYQGSIVEIGPIQKVLDNPKHPYTQALISAISEPDPENLSKTKEIKIIESSQILEGCKFRARCPHAIKECEVEPKLRQITDTHHISCHIDLD